MDRATDDGRGVRVAARTTCRGLARTPRAGSRAPGARWRLLAVRTRMASRVVLTLASPSSSCCFIANTFPASRYLNPVLPFVGDPRPAPRRMAVASATETCTSCGHRVLVMAAAAIEAAPGECPS